MSTNGVKMRFCRRLRFQNFPVFSIVIIVILLYLLKQSSDERARCQEQFYQVGFKAGIKSRDVGPGEESQNDTQMKQYPWLYGITVKPNDLIRMMDDIPENRDKLTIEGIQKFRHLKLRKVCNKLGIRKLDLDDDTDFKNAVYHKVSMDTFYWSDEFKFTVSIIHKIGSKNWRILFSQLRSRTKPLVGGEYLSLVSDKSEVKKRLTEYYNILFVRNPLVRVLSGYRDKFEGRTVPEYMGVGRIIIERYRKGYSTKELTTAKGIKFHEFVMFLLDMNVSRTETIDRHWIPIVYRGRPCELDYDFIGRLETIDRDIPYLYAHLGFNRIVSYNQGQSRKSSESSLLKKYYQQLPEDLFHKLVNVYREDFLLFGYKIPKDRSDFDKLLLSV